MDMQVLALHGLPNVGKDTAGQFLQQEFGASTFAFSDKLYEEVSEAYSLPQSVFRDRATKETPLQELSILQCHDRQFRQLVRELDPTSKANKDWLFNPMSPRRVLQLWGTEFRRRQNPEYWVNSLEVRLIALGREYNVITDARLPNEAVFVKSGGAKPLSGAFTGKIIHIVRDGAMHTGHVSDDPFPYQIIDAEVDNLGDLDMFRMKIVYVAEKFGWVRHR